jgi:hypothetical protein
MRQPENTRGIPVSKKSSASVKGGPRMREPIKKIYCTKCQRLVKGQTQKAGNTTQIVCPRCAQHLWVWEAICWKPAVNVS